MKEILISKGWKFIGRSCGCQGNRQHESYTKPGKKLKIFIKTNKFQLFNGTNWETEKDISEIETYI